MVSGLSEVALTCLDHSWSPPGYCGPEWGKPGVESSHSISIGEGVVESKDKWPCRFVETLQSLVYLCFSLVDFKKWSLNPAGLTFGLILLLLLNRAMLVSLFPLNSEFEFSLL